VSADVSAAFSFLADTYETERLKTLGVWSLFRDDELEFRPAPLARTPHEQMVHQCVSEDLWMTKMLGIATGLPQLPAEETKPGFLRHYAEASARRLAALREKPDAWFGEPATFFDVPRSRAWVLVRRFTHSAHHRAQLTVYLRLLGHPLYSTYGPTADTGGLFQNAAPVIYRYDSVEALLEAEDRGGLFPQLPGPGEKSPTERPGASKA
jgi:uncharacterized damage-inducible protein DinB